MLLVTDDPRPFPPQGINYLRLMPCSSTDIYIYIYIYIYITLGVQVRCNAGHHISCVRGMREVGFSGIIVEFVCVSVCPSSVGMVWSVSLHAPPLSPHRIHECV